MCICCNYLKFGRKFITLIAQYVADHQIEKPDDFIMKSVVNKSGMKVFIIQNIDKKIPLETIAKNKGLSINEILNEIETIVASGTKLNLDYIIDQEIDDNDQDDIYDYFSNFKDDNLDAVFEEFKDSGMSEEHIQLMRIKFLSEYGN